MCLLRLINLPIVVHLLLEILDMLRLTVNQIDHPVHCLVHDSKVQLKSIRLLDLSLTFSVFHAQNLAKDHFRLLSMQLRLAVERDLGSCLG